MFLMFSGIKTTWYGHTWWIGGMCTSTQPQDNSHHTDLLDGTATTVQKLMNIIGPPTRLHLRGVGVLEFWELSFVQILLRSIYHILNVEYVFVS